jgi:hypothetical protein
MMEHFPNGTKLVSDTGGTLGYYRGKELLFKLSVFEGVVDARQYVELIPDGGHIEVIDGLSVIYPRVLSGVVEPDDQYASGANPDWQPTPASAHEINMRVMMAQMGMMSAEMTQMSERLRTAEKMPRAPMQSEVAEALLEDVTAEMPEPETKDGKKAK